MSDENIASSQPITGGESATVSKAYLKELEQSAQQLSLLQEQMKQEAMERAVYEKMRQHHDNRLGIWISIVVIIFGAVAPVTTLFFANKSLIVTAREAKKQGEAALQAAKEAQAVTYFFQALQTDDTDLKISYYTQAIELTPNDADAYYNRGYSYCAIGEFEKAIADFDRVTELKPNDADGYYIRGYAYGQMSDYEMAIECYEKAVKLNRNYAEAYNNLGNTYVKIGEYDKAIAMCKKAIANYNIPAEPSSEYADAYQNRGTTYKIIAKAEMSNGNRAKAIGYYNKAIADFERYKALLPDEDHSMVDGKIKDCTEAIALIRAGKDLP